MNTIDTILNRKSIRKYKPVAMDKNDLVKILECGLNAPSAKNIQNWHFVAIQSKEKIKEIAEIVKKKQKAMIKSTDEVALAESFKSKIKFYTFFENAPVLVLIYASSYESKTSMLLSDEDLKKYTQTHPGIQNIGAAIENILLGATALGYGSCWMTGPNFAIKEIEDYVSLSKTDYSLVAMLPIGKPADDKNPSPKKNTISEKVTFI